MKALIIIAISLISQIGTQAIPTCENKSMLIAKLNHVCKYPIKLQEHNQEAFVAIEYKTDANGHVIKRRVVICNNKKFKKATLDAFDKVKSTQINMPLKTDSIYFQYKIQGSPTPIHPKTNIKIIGYGSCDKPTLMK